MKKVVFGLLICAFLFAGYAAGCFGRYLLYVDLSHFGQVTDAETGEPIPRAVVAVRYAIETLSPAGGVHSNIKFKERVTDEAGKFFIPPMVSARPAPISFFEAPDLLVFKPGYKKVKMNAPWLPWSDELKIRMQPIKTIQEARSNLRYLPTVGRNEWPLLWELVDEEECRVRWDCRLRRLKEQEEDEEEERERRSRQLARKERGRVEVVPKHRSRAELDAMAREIAGAGPRRDEHNMSVASFDLCIFEDEPTQEQELMGVLVQTLDLHDVWGLLLEGHGAAGFMKKVTAALNKGEDRYAFTIGPSRVVDGAISTSVFLYRTSAVDLIRSVTLEDTGGSAAYVEPFCAHFQANDGCFDFALIILYSQPDKGSEEGDLVKRSMDRAADEFHEQDVIVLGKMVIHSTEFNIREINAQYPKIDRFHWTMFSPNAPRGKAGPGDLPITYIRTVVPRSTLKEDYAQRAGGSSYALERLRHQDEEAAKRISENFPWSLSFHVDKDTD